VSKGIEANKTKLCSSTDRATVDLLVCPIEAKRSFLKRKIMENRYTDLFRFIFMLNYFVLLLFFTGVTSAPVTSTPSIIDIMKNDSKLCPTSKFLYDSEYIKPCASTVYPTTLWDHNPKTLNNFLCLGINDTAYKICQYSSQLLNNTALFDSYVKKYVPTQGDKTQEDFCKSLQGFTSLHKTDLFWEQLVQNLNSPKCKKICFDFDDKFQSLCAVFAWIKSIDDMKSAKRIETKHELVVTGNKSHISQSKDGITTTIESKKIETKESKEQNGNQVTDSNNNNNVKEGSSNASGNAQVADSIFDEKIKGRTEKTNNMQKNINNTSETQAHKSENKENIATEVGTNAEVAKSVKDNPPNSNLQTSTINKDTNNINKKIINEGNSEKSKKEQDFNTDLKLSTLSENTQDHYDAENPEQNLENDVAGIKIYLICTYNVGNVYKYVFIHIHMFNLVSKINI